jgi:hypothetical protein
MTKIENKNWHFNKQINLSVLIQLVLLASLIIASYVNLQRQLDSLQKDVSIILQRQTDFQQRIESLSAKSISYEYRIQSLEKAARQTDIRSY